MTQNDSWQKAYKIMWKALCKIQLMKCTCNDKYPCPSAVAFMAVCEVEELVMPKPAKRKKSK